MRVTMSTFVRTRALPRVAVAGGAAVTAVLLLAVPALAHITVTPDSASAGSAAVLTFHVPNEEARADTTRLDMQIPVDHPIAQHGAAMTTWAPSGASRPAAGGPATGRTPAG
jgi:Domain of unkown function (DUF1775)